jgi:thiol-disulfide isomerase/thioredoxin
MKKYSYLMLLCFAVNSAAARPNAVHTEAVSISGTIVDETGKLITYGHIHVGNPEQRYLFDASEHKELNGRGTFSVVIKKGRPHFLHFTAPNHKSLTIYLPKMIVPLTNIKIVLPGYTRNKDVDFHPQLLILQKDDRAEVNIKGKLNGASIFQFNLNNLPDGQFEYRIAGVADAHLSGIAESYITDFGLPANGSFLHDSYKSTVDTRIKKSIEVNFDAFLAAKDEEPVFITDDKRIAAFIEVQKIANKEFKANLEKAARYSEKNGTMEGFDYEAGPYYQYLVDKFKKSADREFKNFILSKIAYLCIGNKYPVEKKYLTEAIDKIKPDDYLWISDPLLLNGLFFALGGFGKGKELLYPLLDSLIEYCPSESMKPGLIYRGAAAAKAAEEEELLKKYIDLLLNNYPESQQAQIAIKRMGTNLKIMKGKALPFFSIVDIDRPGYRLDNNKLSGKICIVDFWATWCVPCIAQFPYLQKAYDKYRSKGLEIISISTDMEIDKVVEFRKKKWKLPWLNGFAGLDKQIAESFEVYAIPKIILISADGTILSASRKELEGENLEITLAKYFDK